MDDDTFNELDELERMFADDDDQPDPTQKVDPHYRAGREMGSLTTTSSGSNLADDPVPSTSRNQTGQTKSFKEKPKLKNGGSVQKIDSFFEKSSVFTDPVFRLRIVKPLVSSTVLLERMQGRTAISFAKVRHHTEHGDRTMDWVIGG